MKCHCSLQVRLLKTSLNGRDTAKFKMADQKLAVFHPLELFFIRSELWGNCCDIVRLSALIHTCNVKNQTISDLIGVYKGKHPNMECCPNDTISYKPNESVRYGL